MKLDEINVVQGLDKELDINKTCFLQSKESMAYRVTGGN